MSEIRCEALPGVLAEAKRGGAAPVYLLYGDEFLYKSAFKTLLKAIVPPRQQSLNYEALDGATADIHEVVARLNTFPLLPGAKVICVNDTQVFYSQMTIDDLVHGEDADVLNEAITAGFPKTNHLILTSESVDKRRKLYATIKKIGVVVDCSVARGEKAADKRQQKEILKAHMRETLGYAGKTMALAGFEVLYEKTGAGLRNFHSELEKLIAFVGDRKEILVDDVRKASEKSKQDPIYELSNAIGERDAPKALLLVQSLLKAKLVPLQILSAATKQVRKMILIADLMRVASGRSWKRGMTYGTFQKAVWPELSRCKGAVLSGNAHPFAVYKTLVHSDNYTFEELGEAMGILLEADIRLKTGTQDAGLVMEDALLRICGTSANPSTSPASRPNPFSNGV